MTRLRPGRIFFEVTEGKRPKSFVVSILNQKLSVRSDGDEAHVLKVSGVVEQRVQDVLDKTKNASSLVAALLTCLNIADELLRSQKGKKDTQEQVAQKVRDLVDLIDLHLQEGQPVL